MDFALQAVLVGGGVLVYLGFSTPSFPGRKPNRVFENS